MDTRNHTILFVGNPGVGKSTLLNGLVGSAVFRAGISYGQGLTTFFQSYNDPSTGNYFVDTPGLEDVKMREQAANEISKALRHDEGLYKIVFVVTEEAGHLRPADGVTMKLVLDALPDKKTPCGIIVNKMSKKKMKVLTVLKSKERWQFLACLNKGRENVTPYISFYPSRDELEDEDDALHEPEGDLYWFLDVLPSVHIKPKEVKDVNVSDFDRQVQNLESMLNKLFKSNEKMEKQVQKMEERLAEEMMNNDSPEIGNLKKLTELDLSYCMSLKTLPPEIGKLKKLTELNLSLCTILTTLTPKSGNLNQLTELNLYSCESLTTLPPEIGNLDQLTELYLGGCSSLTTLPPEIGNLKKLMKLSLHNCRSLTALPPKIGNLNELIELHLSGLTTLPPGIGKNVWTQEELKTYFGDKRSRFLNGFFLLHAVNPKAIDKIKNK